MKKRKVYVSMLLIFLLVSAVFIYLFMNPINPLGTVARAINKNAPPVFAQMIYGGFGPDSLDKPMDATVVNGFVYVSDTNNKRVQVFDLGGNPIFKFGKEGQGKGEFKFPYGIAGDTQGNIFVADLYNGSISVFDSKGNFIKYFAEKDPKEKVIEAPGGLRIKNNKVYVTDIKLNKIMVFDMEGKKLLEFGQPGMKEGQLRAPNGVAIDQDENIWVMDTGNQRMELFDKTGKFVKIVNGSKDGSQANSVFVNPRGIGVDSRGVIYAVSNLTHMVYGFDKDGTQLFTFGGNGQESNKFSLPNGLYIDENDMIYITDSGNQRVAVYK